MSDQAKVTRLRGSVEAVARKVVREELLAFGERLLNEANTYTGDIASPMVAVARAAQDGGT